MIADWGLPMSPPAAPTNSRRNVLRRFGRNRRGSAAVEFALVAPVFFALLFAILETALMFFASQVLETITQNSARMIVTGQAQSGSYTQTQFKTYVCGQIPALFNCANLYVDVESYPAFSNIGTMSSGTMGTTSCGTLPLPLQNSTIGSSTTIVQSESGLPSAEILSSPITKVSLTSNSNGSITPLLSQSGVQVELEGNRSQEDAEILAGDGMITTLCLLRAMEDQTDRKARYRCALALARDGAVIHRSEGTVDGEIMREERGRGGFGYDPLFWLPELRLTMAEVALEEKQKLSHRGRALSSLLRQVS